MIALGWLEHGTRSAGLFAVFPVRNHGIQWSTRWVQPSLLSNKLAGRQHGLTFGATAKVSFCRVLGSSVAARVSALAALRDALLLSKWQNASLREDGAGLEQGTPCFDSVRRARKFLLKHDRSDLASHLERVVTGGSTAGARMATNRHCPLCNEALDTPRHRLECKALMVSGIEDLFVQQ